MLKEHSACLASADATEILISKMSCATTFMAWASGRMPWARWRAWTSRDPRPQLQQGPQNICTPPHSIKNFCRLLVAGLLEHAWSMAAADCLPTLCTWRGAPPLYISQSSRPFLQSRSGIEWGTSHLQGSWNCLPHIPTHEVSVADLCAQACYVDQMHLTILLIVTRRRASNWVCDTQGESSIADESVLSKPCSIQ